MTCGAFDDLDYKLDFISQEDNRNTFTFENVWPVQIWFSEVLLILAANPNWEGMFLLMTLILILQLKYVNPLNCPPNKQDRGMEARCTPSFRSSFFRWEVVSWEVLFEVVPSATRWCTDLLLCFSIICIHASGISIPLSLLMLSGWFLVSTVVPVSVSNNKTSPRFKSGGGHSYWRV